MDQQTITLFFGVGGIAAVIGLIIVAFLQHRTIAAVTDVLQSVNSNPALDAAIAGATSGIPQDVFVKVLAALSAARTIDPNADQQALIDQIAALVKKVEPTPNASTGATA